MIDFSKQPVFLAPLAGITILPFRILCREAGADATVTEMVSAKSMIAKRGEDLHKTATDLREQPVGIQLVGSDPKDFQQAVLIVSDLDYYQWVDINFGCPSPKVTGSRMGADLLNDINRAEQIVASTVKNTQLPVSMKIRLGPDPSKNTYNEFVKLALEYNLAFMTVHARFTCSTYHELAHWDKLAEIKSLAGDDVAIVGNGGVNHPADIDAMRLKTGVDGVMIGRAARNNPLIFSRIEPSREERMKCWRRFVELCLECEIPFRKTRLFSLYFMRDFPKAAILREKLSKASDYDCIDRILDAF